MEIKLVVVAILLAASFFKEGEGGILYPRATETRELLSLDGLWHFTANQKFVDNIEQANDLDINLMTVPSSYNDITTSFLLREHVGAVWYQKKFLVPKTWQNKKVWLRFGSVCYNATVVVNGKTVVTHQIGHLPFVAEISKALNFNNSDPNVITVEVNNILGASTVPQGNIIKLASGRKRQTYTFDFFNYAGIDRPVVLYTTNSVYVDDLTLKTTINGEKGIIAYNVSVEGFNSSSHTVEIIILDKSGNETVRTTQGLNGTLEVPKANFWWPYLMNPNPGYLYTFVVKIYSGKDLVDTYTQQFGIRELKWDNATFTINGEKIYIRGFGRHEDSDIRGKGLDLPTVLRDHNLIKWVGANAYRTSHYPYAEEIMDMADQLGIMIIDEVPAVNTEKFSNGLLNNHRKSLTEIYNRDKNRPSVVIWSVANEPRTADQASGPYYKEVTDHMRSLDKSRPLTIANNVLYNQDHSGQYLDILGVNRYEAWYEDSGAIDVIKPKLVELAKSWHKLHNKPVLITEYGADSVPGIHDLPVFIWSEEFQNAVMAETFQAFDELREEGWLVGEMIWNFADFRTDQTYTRVDGNRKGIFTRQRQPKTAAYVLRERYWTLAKALNNATVPADLGNYVAKTKNGIITRDEL